MTSMRRLDRILLALGLRRGRVRARLTYEVLSSLVVARPVSRR